MKRILVVSACPSRGNSTGVTGKFMSLLDQLDKTRYQISLLDISFYELNHEARRYKVYEYFSINKNFLSFIIGKLPGIRAIFAKHIILTRFKQILRNNQYDGIILFQIPSFADDLVTIAHDKGSKMLLYPWGSEVLRVKSTVLEQLKKAYSKADFIIGSRNSNTMIAARELYNVPEKKLVEVYNDLVVLNKIVEIRKRNLSRDEMSKNIGIPNSSCNIVCGYNGYLGQRHKIIIDAVAKNKDVLNDYQLVFPITYGAADGYVDELKTYCGELGLKYCFITNYLNDEQMACLHLITDLFVEIQPTDNGNAFLIEALFSKNQIVTGKWLSYYQFEQFGEPYHIIETIDDLPICLRQIFTNQVEKIIPSSQLLEILRPRQMSEKLRVWSDLFDRI